MKQKKPASKLEQKIEGLVPSPGVYLFLDEKKQVIYVGKAKKLNLRVRSYFQKSAAHTGKILAMIRNIRDLEIIITDSETEALILENNLIKQHRPRYNILYRDDKSYPYICVSNESRPRIYPTRTVIRDGSRYFGPYGHVGRMKRMLETIRKTFHLCSCACSSRLLDPTKSIPGWGSCFEEYFDNCSAEIPSHSYGIIMDQVVQLLHGRTQDLIRSLKHEMKEHSDNLEYEKAAMARDAIHALEKHQARMKMVSEDDSDRDYFALETDREENISCGVLFQVREGKLVGKYHRFLSNIEGREDAELLQSFMEDYYTSSLSGIVPDEVCCSHELADDEALFDYMWQMKGRKVPILTPRRGEKAQLVRMALANAKLELRDWLLQKKKAEGSRIPHSVKALQRDLALPGTPRRIECFDISNFQGSNTVGSLVCFVDGMPRKSEYKRYHVTSVSGPDDYASMREVIGRRAMALKKNEKQLPDLMVVDGGRGQLSSAVAVLKETGLYQDVPVIGLAKRLEEIYLPGSADPVTLPKTSAALRLLQRLRDEAHRFALEFHRDVRSRKTFRSQLMDIPGIGQKTADKLQRKFGSVAEIAKKSQYELQNEIGKKMADTVYRHFHPDSVAE